MTCANDACGRAEYVRHFTTSEMVVGPVLEARLAKTLLPGIGAAEVARLADECRLASSCVIKATAHRRFSRDCIWPCQVILEFASAHVDSIRGLHAG